MTLVVDENIPLAEAFFGHLGELRRVAGRDLRPEHVRDADVLLVRSVTRVNEALLAGSAVRFVGTCTIGTDHLDTGYLEREGITWTNAPGCNANSVVEYVYAALAALDRDWQGATLGIIGCGNVGGRLYQRMRAQGVDCRVYDPFLTRDQVPDLTDLEQVLGADIICAHTPLTTDGPHPSHHLLNADNLPALKLGAVLLNAGRGPVIDNAALLALKRRRPDLHLVLDVWEPEPDLSVELLDEAALGSPHIAGYSYDGKVRGTEMIYEALCEHLGRAPQMTARTLVPPPEAAEIRVAGADQWQALKQAIAAAYAIHEDDQRLRASPETFDQQRKHYPVRREFFNYRVTAESGALPEALAERLAALGFDTGIAGTED
nr:4-phosphoerythronate dehydrogenase [Marinimicrobium alkaliphilum]